MENVSMSRTAGTRRHSAGTGSPQSLHAQPATPFKSLADKPLAATSLAAESLAAKYQAAKTLAAGSNAVLPNVLCASLVGLLAAALTAALVIALALLPTKSAMAETEYRLETLSDSTKISEGYALPVDEWSAETQAGHDDPSTRSRRHDSHPPDVWTVAVGTLLFNDHDHDGYFAGLSLTLDVDVSYGHTDIYAAIYMQHPAAPATLLHTTGTFSIYEDSASDEYRIDVELIRNYLPAHYDVHIDIHDAWSNQIVDSVSAHGFTNLRGLPLESEPPRHLHDDILVTEYTGQLGPGLIAALTAWYLLRRRDKPLRAKTGMPV